MTKITTCQICGREIKTVRGYPIVAVDGRGRQSAETDETIAHHGYERPGDGWQTASCMGARWRPYEAACDAIPLAIEACERHLESTRAALAKWLAEPPQGITREPSLYDRRDPVTLLRPDNFDPEMPPGRDWDGYAGLYDRRRAEFTRSITASERQLSSMRKRLANWPRRNERAA